MCKIHNPALSAAGLIRGRCLFASSAGAVIVHSLNWPDDRSSSADRNHPFALTDNIMRENFIHFSTIHHNLYASTRVVMYLAQRSERCKAFLFRLPTRFRIINNFRTQQCYLHFLLGHETIRAIYLLRLKNDTMSRLSTIIVP